ncbi:SH2 domain-containing protein 7-like, partial [Plectropomus leopardus]|uniref:SH2 domain-containing protein 7-like n=1 Tax=Plectropomus leopardus TaxID=160734 RepID=UPI001C4BEA52
CLRDTEDLLRDKALGCFLIRLSEKAIGYILSYKGHDRCRHFVITQNQDGQFVISGDCQTHGSLSELIEHYRVSPIQPFGEYLTSSCYQVNSGELYDVVNYKDTEKSGVSVQALRTLWDHRQDVHGDPGNNQRRQHQSGPPAAQPPAAQLPVLPQKSKSRKLTGTVSADTVSLSQVVPPVPKRGIPLSFSLSGSLPETTPHPSETRTDPSRSQRLGGNATTTSDALTDPGSPAGTTSPSQLESRSTSLPRLHHRNTEEEEEQEEQQEQEEQEYSNRLSSASFSTSHSPPALKRVTCHTYSLHDPRDASSSQQQDDDVELSRSNPLYEASEGLLGSPVQQRDVMYAEVSQRPPPTGPSDDTYEQIPGEVAVQANTYESLEDVKTKKSKSTWGKNNMNWKKFLPDYKKK